MNYTNILHSIIAHQVGINRLPSFVTYFVTMRCNSHCVFCDVWKNPPQDVSQELNCDEIEKIFRQFKHLDVLRISGGEPFIRTDLDRIINVIDRASQPGLIHITTNGLLTDRILAVVARLQSPRKIHIKVSIDDIGEKHDQVRGTKGAYEKAISTVKGLVALRDKYGFHLGVNQAIVSEQNIDSFEALQNILKEMGVPVYSSIAFQSKNSLYSNELYADMSGSYKPFGDFSEAGLKRYLEIVKKNQKTNKTSLAERMVDDYHQRGIYNRFVKGKAYPNPSCVALSDHLRLMPNGDVPVCLYNGTIMGNLRKTPLNELWRSPFVAKTRGWVKQCPGCWQSCETAVSAVYTGDIIKGLLPNPHDKGK